MHRYFTLVLVLFLYNNAAFAGLNKCKDANGNVTFSDTSCVTANTVEKSAVKTNSGSTMPQEQTGTSNGVYTKNMESMQAPDDATQACFNAKNTTAYFPDPSTTKLLSSTKKWVTVKNVGARQMIRIETTSKNEAGMYIGIKSFNCLLMGDGITISPYPYELL